MIHKLRDKKQIAKRNRTLYTLIWVGAFLLLVAAGLFSWSGTFLSTIGRPIWKIESIFTTKAQDAGYVVRTKASVFNENTVLTQENTDLKASMVDYQILKTENNQLKELLGRLPTTSTFILGNILTKPNRSPYDTIIIDIGSNAGLTQGSQVFANAETPIGLVSKVYSSTALVVLYSSPGQTTEATLDGSNANVELIGRGGGDFEMSVPIDLSAEKGTSVVLPGATPQVVAIVEQVISAPTDPVKKILLRSPVNVQSLKWVEIKKN